MLHLILGLTITGSPAHADDAVAWISYEEAQRQKRKAKRRATAKRKAAERARRHQSTVIVVTPSQTTLNAQNTKVVIRDKTSDLERFQRQAQRRLAMKRAAQVVAQPDSNVEIPQSQQPIFESNADVEPTFRKSLSFGLRAGATTSDLNEGATDAGLGIAIGYRLFEPLGLELSYIDYGDRIDLAADSPLQASAQLFLFPWHEVNPYVSGGLTVAKVADAKNQTDIKSAPDGYGYGPHAGMGVQFGGLDNVAITVEARYNSFSNIDKDGSLQGILGVDYYF